MARDHKVTVLFNPPNRPTTRQQTEIAAFFAGRNIRLLWLEPGRYSRNPADPVAVSYAVFRQLFDADEAFDTVHFHDYKGMGYHCLCARDQGLAFADTVFVVQMHGPGRWRLEHDGELFTDPAQLKADFMERQSIARADYLISPSHYMLSWLQENGWAVPPADRCLIIQPPCRDLATALRPLAPEGGASPMAPENRQPVCEIIFPARHDHRDGFTVFCDALDLIAGALAERQVRVSFSGGFGLIGDEHSGTLLASRGRIRDFPIRLLPFDSFDQAASYLAHADQGLVVLLIACRNLCACGAQGGDAWPPGPDSPDRRRGRGSA